MREITKQEKEVFEYLNELRESGETNMFGAVPYIVREFPDLIVDEARNMLSLWMKNFNKEGKYETIKT